MKSRGLKLAIFTIILAGGVVLFFFNIGKFPNYVASAAEESVGLPTRLLIPVIKVNALIDGVGLLADGSMGIPKIPSKAAWFNLGPRPGEAGSAALAGHVNWWTGAVGAFARLNKLKPGDKIIVKDDKGMNINFIVNKIRLYGAREDATDVFFSNDGLAHLNLITCGGVWNKLTKQYTKRLVIFADREIK